MDQLQACGETQLALALAGAVWPFWRDRAFFAEGRRRIESALQADERPTAARAKALNAAASMAALGGDAASGRARAEEALAVHRLRGDERGSAESELWLGWAIANEGDWARARPLFDRSARRFRELGDEHQSLLAASLLAMTCAELGDRERAQALDEDNLRRARELHNEQLEATTLDGLARHALDKGRLEDAVSMATESLRIYHGLGDPHGVAIELRRCACAFALKGRARTATRLLASAEALHTDIGGTMPWVTRMKGEALATIRTQLDEAVLAEAWEQGRALTADEAISLALNALDEAD
jgi:non-specific serine/threonine protein kinase